MKNRLLLLVVFMSIGLNYAESSWTQYKSKISDWYVRMKENDNTFDIYIKNPHLLFRIPGDETFTFNMSSDGDKMYIANWQKGIIFGGIQLPSLAARKLRGQETIPTQLLEPGAIRIVIPKEPSLLNFSWNKKEFKPFLEVE